jgi:hypothetical protein
LERGLDWRDIPKRHTMEMIFKTMKLEKTTMEMGVGKEFRN